MEVTYRVALEVAYHEALVRRAYKDSVGVWTWSVGLTNATGHNVERYIDNPQTLEHCLKVFAWALKSYAKQVQEVFADHPLTEEQFAAALSFHWNTGAIKHASWVRHWKAGRLVEARRTFMLWRKPKEIIKRREAERDLFFYGQWANDGTMTEFTRLTKNHTPVWRSARKIDVSHELRAAFDIADYVEPDHAPDPDADVVAPTLSRAEIKEPESTARTVAKTPEGKGGIATGVGGVGTVLTETAGQLQPLLPYADALKWVFLAIMVVGIGITTYALIRREMQEDD